MYKLVFGLMICFFFQIYNKAFAQNFDWSQVIYNHNGISVELLYTLNDPCTNGVGKKSRFSYRITGTPTGYDYFLNWKMDYYNCDGQLIRQTTFVNLNEFESGIVLKKIDWRFDGARVQTWYDSVYTSRTPDQAPSYVRIPPRSEPPSSIAGNLTVDYGDGTSLSQKGGTLGLNARWKWYTDNCGGTLVNEGETIYVSPQRTTEYFVRAEGPGGNTACYSVRVVVNRESRPATHIEGKAFICRNETTSLKASGGKLGEGANWVWYQNSLNSQPIGKGATINVSPTVNTIYYVRAEGVANTTAEQSIELKVVEDKLLDPIAIKSIDQVCSGSDLVLQVSGGKLSEGAAWHWYKDEVKAANLIGKGETITTKSYSNTTYYVRGEGVCKTTSERSKLITITNLSVAPGSITGDIGRLVKRKARLSVSGGTLGEGAAWRWYKGECCGKSIRTGASIAVRPKKTTTYYVRAEGECNVTDYAKVSLVPNRNLKHFFINAGVVPNFQQMKGHELPELFNETVDRIKDNPTVALTIGSYRKSGWYLRGKYTLNSKRADLDIQDGEVINAPTTNSDSANYFVFDGKTAANRWSVTGGLITKLNRNSLFLQLGAGYGQRTFMWKTDAYSESESKHKGTYWGKVAQSSFSGIELEAGLMVRVLIFNIMAGANFIIPSTSDKSSKYYSDAYAGVGFTF